MGRGRGAFWPGSGGGAPGAGAGVRERLSADRLDSDPNCTGWADAPGDGKVFIAAVEQTGRETDREVSQEPRGEHWKGNGGDCEGRNRGDPGHHLVGKLLSGRGTGTRKGRSHRTAEGFLRAGTGAAVAVVVTRLTVVVGGAALELRLPKGGAGLIPGLAGLWRPGAGVVPKALESAAGLLDAVLLLG